MKNCPHKNLVNLSQSSTHHGPNCPDYNYRAIICLHGQFFTRPNQENKLYMMSLISMGNTCVKSGEKVGLKT